MTKIDNLNSGQLAPFIRRIENLERALSLASSSVERGRMRFYDGSELLIQDSNLNVVGTATIRGTLRADGTIAFTGTLTQSGPSTFTGKTNVSGDFTVTGPTKLNGKTDIGGNTSVTGDLTVTGPTKLNGKTDIGGNTSVDGTLDIKGKSTLQNDLTVQGGGQIKVGANMALNPAKNGGSIDFANGTEVSSTGPNLNLKADNARLLLGTSTATLGGGSSSMIMAGSSTSLNTPLVLVSDRLMAPSLRAAPAGAKANLYCDPSTGEIMRAAA